MKYYVFYEDDYQDAGGVGLEEFDKEREATEFIESRISQEPTRRDLSKYKLIRGKPLELEAVQTIAKVKVV